MVYSHTDWTYFGLHSVVQPNVLQLVFPPLALGQPQYSSTCQTLTWSTVRKGPLSRKLTFIAKIFPVFAGWHG
jgi:hypothetical protein